MNFRKAMKKAKKAGLKGTIKLVLFKLHPKKNIVIFSRTDIDNYGDPIIGDCCEYIIKKTAPKMYRRVTVEQANILNEKPNYIMGKIKDKDVIVFPGGGMNSVVFNKKIINIMNMLKQQPKSSVFFNSVGILKVKPNPKNEELLKEIFNNPQVKQVTTRGDLTRLQENILSNPLVNKYPSQWILDPAIWASETYKITKNENADTIGINVIRPEIFNEKYNSQSLTADKVVDMYINIIKELELRGYKWKLFTNGMKSDYQAGLELAKKMGIENPETVLLKTTGKRNLVENIAGFKAIIAARLHANIIATSLQVPQVGMVWNDKMNLFAEIVDCQDRYINGADLENAKLIVDTMEKSIEEGYNTELINKQKAVAINTIKNIIRG